MELPHLGENCALELCNQLDFLPIKCDACRQIFCIRHYQYDSHRCEKAKDRNVQVPVCPLCSEPVPSRRDVLPDAAVSQHMDQYCKQNDLIKDAQVKPKSSLQSCNFKSCRQKDVIYLECGDCKSKFCVKHRHPSDHSCTGPSLASNWHNFKGSCSSRATSSLGMIKNKAHQISSTGQAALNRLKGSTTGLSRGGTSWQSGANTKTTNDRFDEGADFSSLQGNVSESEALAIALNESKVANLGRTGLALNDGQDEDLAIARAIHESQLEARDREVHLRNKDACAVI